MCTFVVGVDGSDPSVKALRFATRLASTITDAEVVIVYARYIQALVLPEHVAEDEFSDVLDATARIVELAAMNELAECSFPWRVEIREGEPSHVLRAIASEAGDDAIVVVGREGWSTARELLLGSVSNRLVHQNDTAVLLVP